MTAPYDEDALWFKAKLFLNRAMDGSEERAFDERALWASLALELLGKAALSRTSPLLIAEPTEDGKNLLVAAGLVQGEALFTSVRAKTIFSRCQRAFPPFSEDEAKRITAARNEYLHGGTPGFTQIPELAWWPRYWRQAVILNNAVDCTIDELVGPDREAEVEAHLTQNKQNMEHRVEMLIHQASTRLAQHKAGTLPAKVAKQWTPGSHPTYLGLTHSSAETCPACGSNALLEGDYTLDTQLEVERYSDDDWGAAVTLTIASEHFGCSNCGLILATSDLLEGAGLPTSFHVEGDGDDLAIEPEYGND